MYVCLDVDGVQVVPREHVSVESDHQIGCHAGDVRTHASNRAEISLKLFGRAALPHFLGATTEFVPDHSAEIENRLSCVIDVSRLVWQVSNDLVELAPGNL